MKQKKIKRVRGENEKAMGGGEESEFVIVSVCLSVCPSFCLYV